MLKKLLAENFLNTDLHLNQFHFRTGVYKTSCTLSKLSAFTLMQRFSKYFQIYQMLLL